MAALALVQFFQCSCAAAPSSAGGAAVTAPGGTAAVGARAASAGAKPTEAPASKLKPVLDNNVCGGNAKAIAGYDAARQCPEICAKLFCYCGCDNTDDHHSLLDCFTSDHGVDCYICQEEALIALQMKKKGKSLGEIQKVVDLAYKKEYPWDEPSQIFLQYKAAREWKDPEHLLDKLGDHPDASSATDKKAGTTGDAKKGKTAASQPNAKSAKKESCCGGKAKAK